METVRAGGDVVVVGRPLCACVHPIGIHAFEAVFEAAFLGERKSSAA